ncbi:DNA polymerase III subunit delta' [Paenibacillus tarimensis]|uniref:DNA polymerase III subunit delta' n=1 Tax=Paenibacillus tarimensis TaxID=416012 RepID=UPI001F2B9FC4|nr:DNA polymerase III subunit delta' [Paenibacillus tarimensis]MCF2946241.1 DNA polymerase III subunit delta' [Paenibacillus tarimensis]
MSFQTIPGQDKAKRILQTALRREQVSHAYLFSGPQGTGREAAALAFAQALFCEKAGDDACGECLACRKFMHGNEPDLHRIAPEGASIKIDQIRELQRDMSYRAESTKRKVYIMEQAEKMTLQAANGLLKFLEEPAASVVAILITENSHAVLPTIRSRAQLVPFLPVSRSEMLGQLLEEGQPELLARAAVQLASGLDASRRLIQQEGFAETRNVVIQLGKDSLERFSSAIVTAGQQVFKSGLDYSSDLLIALLVLWYKDLLHIQAGRKQDLVYIDQADWLSKHAFQRPPETWVRHMELALEAERRIRAHVSPQLALEQFLVSIQEG